MQPSKVVLEVWALAMGKPPITALVLVDPTVATEDREFPMPTTICVAKQYLTPMLSVTRRSMRDQLALLRHLVKISHSVELVAESSGSPLQEPPH